MLTTFIALAAAAQAQAGAPAAVTPPGLRMPERLTAGAADQLLGALAPDGKTLYFISDEEATTQVYVSELARGVPTLLFDEVADVSWPRPSPDGKRLLYISYRTDAAGDLCVRDLPKGERRCLTDDQSAEVQAIWLPDGDIAVVTRAGLHGDFALVRYAPGGARRDVLVKDNLSSPAVSPDGQWLAYVPVERGSSEVGPSFLARAGGALVIAPLGGGAPSRVDPDLPGASGFPAFSTDGRWLYFTQFLNDTNLDGAIDGNDNGVLFRAPFAAGRLGAPEQLTSARWSCQYPAPAADRLIATCLLFGSLDVFTLPLDGAVPPDWTDARIAEERAASRDRWEQLLLLSRHKGDPAVHLADVVRLHLELHEFESAGFYAARLAGHDPEVGKVLGELAAHRKAERALSRGMLSAAFVADARARLQRLSSMTHPLARIARSEIHDTLGEEDAARSRLDGVATSDPLVAHFYGERLLALYRGEARFFELYLPIAERDLEHAQIFVRELGHGAGAEQRARLAEAWLRRVQPDGEVAFLLELERALAPLRPENQEPVREAVFTIYRKNKDLMRRKALVDTTVARAAAADNEFLLYNFANSWVSYVPRESAERRRAEVLYRDAVLERAYVLLSRDQKPEARSQFYAVTLQTDALEAHGGFLELRLLEKQDPLADYQKRGDGVVTRYARAYLMARGLPAETDLARHERTAREALALLEGIALVAPQRSEVHHLWAWIAHQRFLRGGGRLAAVEANAHYLLALDLARDNPRQRAAILDGVGRVQSSVGNHAIAVGWLEERRKLPFMPGPSRLSHTLALARARYHTADEKGAAALADEAVALAGGELARFRPLALDRSAFYHLLAGDAAAAAERYATLWPLVEPGAGAEATRNRLVTRIGWAAAELGAGRAAAALEHITAAEALLSAGTPAELQGPYGRLAPRTPVSLDEHRLLLAGLRAQAHFAQGQLPEATAAMTRRRDGLRARVKAAELDEDRLELAAAEAQLARYAHRRGANAEALGHLEAALREHDTWAKNTGSPVDDLGMAIVAAYAELHLFAGLPLAQLTLDPAGRVKTTYTALSELRNPAWEPMRARLELYLTMFSLRRS
jgi:hypothetical protein